MFTILLIEDERQDARAIEERLRESDLRPYRLNRATSLAEGLEMLEQYSDINIVLLDLHLDDSSGLATFDTVHRAYPQLPIIVLTGLMDSNVGITAVEHGAQNFLEKGKLTSHLLNTAIRFAIVRKKLTHRLEQTQVSARMASWELDPSNRQMRWSAFIHDIFDASHKDYQLETLEDFLEWVYPEDRDMVQDGILLAMSENTTFEREFRLRSGKNTIVFVDFKAWVDPTPTQSRFLVAGTLQDITSRKRMDQLKQEKELADRTAKLRQDFLARTSHEIRTPLNPILLLTKLLLESDLSVQQREYLEAIESAGKTLLAVVNDILDLSKIEAGKIQFLEEPFQLSPILRQIEGMMSGAAKENETRLHIEYDNRLPDTLIGDSVRLSQILLNLLSNAIKFTQGGDIWLRVTQESREHRQVNLRFVVQDTGIGIPEDKLKVIFESFQQVPNEFVRRHGGTGLGLTIVKQLVKLQGGDVEVQSTFGEGSTFSFTLPLTVSQNRLADKEEEVITQDLAGAKLMLVEDNPLNQLVTKKLLEDWGVHLTIANHGQEAIQFLEQEDFDLILMDVQMPVMDGLDTTRHVRGNMPAPKNQTPIIALTANAFSGTNDECLRVGMTDYVSKPIEIANLHKKLMQYLPSPEARVRVQEGNDTLAAALNHPSTPDIAVPTAPTDSTMAEQKLVDLTYLEEVSSGDSMIIRLALQKFLETTPGIIEHIQTNLEAKNHQELQRGLHKLKGSLHYVGVTPIHDITLKAETALKTEQNLDKIVGWVETIVSSMDDVYEEVRTKIEAI